VDTEHMQWLVGLITGLDMKDDNSLLLSADLSGVESCVILWRSGITTHHGLRPLRATSAISQRQTEEVSLGLSSLSTFNWDRNTAWG